MKIVRTRIDFLIGKSLFEQTESHNPHIIGVYCTIFTIIDINYWRRICQKPIQISRRLMK